MKNILFLLIVLASCKVANQSAQETSIPGNDPAIIFVVLKIKNDSVTQHNSIELLNKTISSGKIKNENQLSYVNFLSIDLYKKDKLIKTTLIEHPLYKNLEYLDNNSRFVSKKVVLAEADFFTRFQINGKGNEIRIFETIKSNSINHREIGRIKL